MIAKNLGRTEYPGGLSVEKFRELFPEYKDINDERLWNAMEDYVLSVGKIWVPLEEDGYTENTYDYGTCVITMYTWNTYICKETGETKSGKELFNEPTPTQNVDSWRMETLDFGVAYNNKNAN